MNPVPASERTVLVVDDDEDIVTFLEIVVHREGFRVLTAADGVRALRLLKEAPQAVVLDLVLPGDTDGFRVLETLRTLPSAPAVFVITGMASAAEAVERDRPACVRAVLRKPLNQESLLKQLHETLGTVACEPPRKGGA